MARMLLLDLEVFDGCDTCDVGCERDDGVVALRERAAFALVCRRCRHASCVAACPCDALERGADGILRRHNLRCVSCKSCVAACPFGTIHPEMIPFYSGVCDSCGGSADGRAPGVASCEEHGIEYRDVDPAEADVYVLDEGLAVRAPRWDRKEEER